MTKKQSQRFARIVKAILDGITLHNSNFLSFKKDSAFIHCLSYCYPYMFISSKNQPMLKAAVSLSK